MSDAFRLLDTLRDGARLLDANARRRVVEGVFASALPDGGFSGRDGRSDLYYAPYALWVLKALDAASPNPQLLAAYLERCARDPLDATHRASLVQTAVLAGYPLLAESAAEGIEAALASSPGLAFLSAVASSSVGRRPPTGGSPSTLVADTDGVVLRPGTATPVVVATILLAIGQGGLAPAPLVAMLLDVVDAKGGLRATVRAVEADLLSTATGLFALRAAGQRSTSVDMRRHVDFVTGCWRDSGLFASTPTDPDERGDVEYTFHALLALGAITR